MTEKARIQRPKFAKGNGDKGRFEKLLKNISDKHGDWLPAVSTAVGGRGSDRASWPPG